MVKEYLKRRWFDFRMGHSIYLIFFLSFANFILIFFRLLIEKIPVLDQIFSELWVFIVLFICIYVPIAVIMGAWHRKSQKNIEHDIGMLHSPLQAKYYRLLLKMQLNQASMEEIKEMMELLEKIEKGHGQD